jgi:predicted GIY-YIG superfamily endonuclease
MIIIIILAILMLSRAFLADNRKDLRKRAGLLRKIRQGQKLDREEIRGSSHHTAAATNHQHDHTHDRDPHQLPRELTTVPTPTNDANKSSEPSTQEIIDAHKRVSLRVQPSHTGWDNDKQAFMKGLQPTDYSKILDNALIVNIGRRRSGKSHNCDWIMYNKRDVFPWGVVFTKTKFNGFWQKRCPNAYIYNGYKPDVLRRLFEHQQKLVAMGDDCPVNRKMFVIIDDCASQTELMHCEQIKEAANNGRHYDMLFLINTQYAFALSTTIRGNADDVFIFEQQQRRQREAVVEDFIDRLDKKEAIALLDAVTEVKYTALHVSANDRKLFIAKAETPPEYKLGCKEYWDAEVVARSA